MLILCPLNRGQSPPPTLIVDEKDPYFGGVQWHVGVQTGEENPGRTPIASEGSAVLRVYTEKPEFSGKNEAFPAVLGKYLWEENRLIFQPRFPFLSGRTYWAWYSDGLEPAARISEIKIPAPHSLKPPKVTALFPTGDQWPANQLKFYIYFDQPMRPGQVSEGIQLYDDSGKKADAPFLELGEELWDPDLQRLTIWFDPGRIKSHLIPNQRLGPPLQPNRTYHLIINTSWRAANGLTLGEDYVKSFQTGPKDTSKPDPEKWTLTLPASGTLDPMQIHFPEAMDVALLFSGFGILTGQKEVLNGKIKIGKEEKSWFWYPEQPWEKADYILRISTDVEDLAGNNLLRLFDTPAEAAGNLENSRPHIDKLVIIK